MSTAPAADQAVAARRAVERRALRASLIASIVIAVGAITLGALSGTRIIIVDGAYMSIGLILSWASLAASTAAASGPTRRFPFGRDALAPLMVVLQGVALAGTLVFAVGDAIVRIRAGGAAVSPLIIAVYGASTAVAGAIMTRWLGRAARGSDLIAAALLAAVPVRLVAAGVNELLEGAPPAELAARIASAVEQVRGDVDLPDPVIRAGKVGLKIYVEVDFLVDGVGWDIAREDAAGRAVTDGLEALGLDVWTWVAVTTRADLVD